MHLILIFYKFIISVVFLCVWSFGYVFLLSDQLSALMVVCMNRPSSPDRNTEACVDLLLEQGALVNARDRYGMTPLLYACQSGQYLVARKLVAAGADANARETRGWTVSVCVCVCVCVGEGACV